MSFFHFISGFVSKICFSVVVCEGDYANFSCPEGQYISLNIANYGRFSLGICNKDGIADWSTTCQNSQTLGILQDL